MLPLHPDDHDHARFRLAMASSGIGMAVATPQGEYLQVNPALCRLFGCEAAALVGARDAALTDAGDVARSEDAFARLASGECATVEVDKRYRRSDGSAIEAVVNAAMLPADGAGKRHLLLQFRDQTAQRASERALRALEEDLERRVRERTAELETAQRRLEAFAFGVSHDLRAPVRAIDGFAMQLARQAGDALDQAGHEQLARIRHASARMAGLIDSLGELAQIGRAPLRPRAVDVSLLAEWALAELQEAEPEREARLHVQPGLQAVGDERLLKLLLSQLLRNAWRFSASREAVEIDVEGGRTPEGLTFVVRDRGIGFDMAYVGKLFEPFQRLHGSAQGAGDGIGLTIAQQVVARHGGRIVADAQADAGARFRVELRDLPQPGHDPLPHNVPEAHAS